MAICRQTVATNVGPVFDRPEKTRVSFGPLKNRPYAEGLRAFCIRFR